MQPAYLLALDAGGSGGRCLIADAETGELVRAFRPWSLKPAPGTGGAGTDIDLPLVWERLCAAAREAMELAGAKPSQVVGVGATSIRHATVVLDKNGAPLLSASNRDSRAIIEAMEMQENNPGEIYKRTGHWPSPLCAAARLQWLANNNPDGWKQAAVVIALSDWITYRLCGKIATDVSQACGTLLLDVHTRDWAPEFAELFKVPANILPPLRVSGERIGELTKEAAEALGLRTGTPVAVGGGDTQCGILGMGAVGSGQAGAVVGTTAPVQLVTDHPYIDQQERVWTGCHVVPGLWVVESNAGTMGDNLDWLARIVFADSSQPAARFLAEAGLSEPGAKGILSTLGTDVMNVRALQLPTGNLTLSYMSTGSDPQCRPHLARGVVEGMAYALRANLDQASETVGSSPNAMCLTGRISRSAVFVRILADVLGIPVEVGPTGESTALGAAICAGAAGGLFGDLAEGSRRFAGRLRTVHPDEERSRTYAGAYEGWKKLRAAQADANRVAVDLILPSVLHAMAEGATEAETTFRPRVLITADMDKEALDQLRDFADVEYASFRQTLQILSGPALVKALAGIQVFVTEVDVVDAKVLAKLPDLRVIATCRGDAVNVDPPACEAYGIPVLNAPGRNADAVADLAVAFMVMLARKLPVASAFLRQPDVEAGDMGRMGQAFTTLQGRELWRKTVGLVGMGAVGRAVTKRLLPFGTRVLVHDPYLPAEAVLREGAEPASLEEVIEQSDFVSLHAAVTDETTGMIGATEFGRMKEGSFLINTARAALIDEEALVAALQSGHVGGAAMDVFAVEPPGADHPLFACENVIATPHSGGNTVEVGAHQGQIIAADLRRLVRGETPHHVLNRKVLDKFDWTKPRPEPDREALDRLASKAAPAVTDLQRDQAAQEAQEPQAAATASPAASAGPLEVDPEIRDRMDRILRNFVDLLKGDDSLREFSADQDVTLFFTLPDLDLRFYFRLRNGEVSGDMGAPEVPAEVALKLRAEVLDGMFTGKVNPMQAATTGGLSFQGDTLKAMTLQYIQEDLSRLYMEAREKVGDPGDLASLARPAGAARTVTPAGPGDIRSELIEVVNELYQSGLITATGGNVSARSLNKGDEIWITRVSSSKETCDRRFWSQLTSTESLSIPPRRRLPANVSCTAQSSKCAAKPPPSSTHMHLTPRFWRTLAYHSCPSPPRPPSSATSRVSPSSCRAPRNSPRRSRKRSGTGGQYFCKITG